ncbi:hypothetical protein HK103_003758 [Boothiomyces macroporosus]|uniref:Phosphatidate phosphatase APP1 catalytic domain-containing protein n=1 Tax=Boothiomyces macroporosus TaxID=261099 RepID=A0AAD5Y8R9_9FUNG|nr:hypothetical protein HK103_003758 [Boothiomyces macroporosus]
MMGTTQTQILLFPTYASLNEVTNEWKLNIKGWAFKSTESSKRSRFFRSVTRRMLAPINGSSEHNKQVFAERTSSFFSAPLEKSTVRICVVGVAPPHDITAEKKDAEAEDKNDELEFDKLDKAKLTGDDYIHADMQTDQNGIFTGSINIPQAKVDEITKDTKEEFHGRTRLRVIAFLPNELESNVFGNIPLIEPEGISLVSDVDDTIKHSCVYDGLLTAAKVSLFGDFKDVPGMRDSYNLLYSKKTAFHYVSAGPFQLLPVVGTFINSFNFPEGSLILRNTSEVGPVDYKIKVIKAIIKDFPKRKFIMVGDSGEYDIEVYSKVHLAYPEQVSKIFIRNVGTGQDVAELEKRAKTAATDAPLASTTWTKLTNKVKSEEVKVRQIKQDEVKVIKELSWKLFADPTDLITDTLVLETMKMSLQ